MNSENSLSPKEQLKQWLNKLDPSRRSTIEKIWDQAGETDQSRQVQISDDEKKEAFSRIAAETGIDTNSLSASTEDKAVQRNTANWKWYAAAAVIVLAAGLSYLTIPIQVSVPYGERANITLPDNSEVILNSGTTITYNRLYGYMDRELSLEGEAFFDVEKGDLPFTVHTTTATVKVLGTRFNLRSWKSDTGAETTVTLEEGSLAFYAPGTPEQSVIIEPGESSSIRTGLQKPTVPTQINTDRSMAWIENRFAFERRPLGEIIREIERRFDITVTVQPRQILLDSLTIYYSNEISAEQIIQDICQSKALNYREANGGYIIESP